MPSRKQQEAELAQALIQFHKEHLGRGPEAVRVVLHPDSVLCRCAKVLLPHELALLRLPDAGRNRRLVKQMRREMVEQHGDHLKDAASAILGAEVVSLHHDLCPVADECVIVLTLGPARPRRPPVAP